MTEKSDLILHKLLLLLFGILCFNFLPLYWWFNKRQQYDSHRCKNCIEKLSFTNIIIVHNSG